MSIDIAAMENQINKLITHCCDKAFKNKGSLTALRTIFEQLRDLRQDLSIAYINFPKNNSVNMMIQDIQKAMNANTEMEKLEWTYDHYIDLFKFEAEQLLNHITLNIKPVLAYNKNWD